MKGSCIGEEAMGEAGNDGGRQEVMGSAGGRVTTMKRVNDRNSVNNGDAGTKMHLARDSECWDGRERKGGKEVKVGTRMNLARD